MKMAVLAVRDIKTDQFSNPMFTPSIGSGQRAFTDAVNNQDKDNQLYLHPEDFELYELGTYDTQTGLFDTGSPKQLTVGSNVKT